MRQILLSDDDFIRFVISGVERRGLKLPAYNRIIVEDISGNINYVRRVTFFDKVQVLESYIVKSVPKGGVLARYPDIVFPESRLVFEASYYRQLKALGLTCVPELYDVDVSSTSLLLEDLSSLQLLEDLAGDNACQVEGVAFSVVSQLAKVHHSTALIAKATEHNPSAIENIPFVYELPLSHAKDMRSYWPDDDLAQARHLAQESVLLHQTRLLELSRDLQKHLYTDESLALCHGDLHMGSIFFSQQGSESVKFIDAELSDVMAAWYDVGVLYAHFCFLAESCGQQLNFEDYMNCYVERRDADAESGFVVGEAFITRAKQTAGFEMLRRLIGAANVNTISTPDAIRHLTGMVLSLLDIKTS